MWITNHELNLINEYRLHPNELTSIINNFGASITSLEVDCCCCIDADLLGLCVNLVHLEITTREISNDAMESIAKMKKINCLKLGNIKEDNLIRLAKELPELRELHITNVLSDMILIGLAKMLKHAAKLSTVKMFSMENITIHFVNYLEMLKTVQSRPEKIKLAIDIESQGDKVNVPEEILAANRDILSVVNRKW